MTFAKAYKQFKSDYPRSLVGKSKFCELRSAHVLLTQNVPHNVCMSGSHQNVILLLGELTPVHPEILLSSAGFFVINVCDVNNNNCKL